MDTIVAVWQDLMEVTAKQVRPILYLQSVCLFLSYFSINDFSSIPCVTSISELVLAFLALLSLSLMNLLFSRHQRVFQQSLFERRNVH